MFYFRFHPKVEYRNGEKLCKSSIYRKIHSVPEVDYDDDRDERYHGCGALYEKGRMKKLKVNFMLQIEKLTKYLI